VRSVNEGLDVLNDFAMDLIQRAGEQALAYYGQGEPRLKFDEALVTEAGLHLEGFFREALQTRFPDHSIFANEQSQMDYSHEGKRYLWIYDTLDGAANFQAGIPIWGISLALVENFWPILGVFYMPATGDIFHAMAGGKAFHGNEEIRVPIQDDINDESILLTYSRFHHLYRSRFPGKILNLGCTGSHICYVAKGRADGALVAHESFRDLAAARVILEAGGGKFFTLDGKEMFLNEYLDGKRIEDHLLAVSPGIVDQVREYLDYRP
jgi:myo-inositol-1(or 4)-monophosphatase